MEGENYPTLDQLDELRKIWTDAGPMPAYHIAQKTLLQIRWPQLWLWMHDQFGE